jgi:ubiquitin-small subunit ribosomal protein S27Ae
MADKKPVAKGKVVAKAKGQMASSLYDVSSGSIKRKNKQCPKCGPGIFLAEHKDRNTCGKCGYMEKR